MWTKNKILQTYRFCNICRELDKTTIWIRENWRDPHRKDPNIFFAMVVARLINKPESLDALDVKRHILNWDPKSFTKIMRLRMEAGERVFAPAYMIRADAGAPGQLKTDYLAARVLSPLWKDRETVRPRPGDTLATFFARLRCYRDMGPFIAGQIVVDCKWHSPLKEAIDWWNWCTPGPGSLRGMSWIEYGNEDHKYKTEEWHAALQKLQVQIDPLMREAALPRLSASDLQNTLCEVGKYERARTGIGRPKQLYY